MSSHQTRMSTVASHATRPAPPLRPFPRLRVVDRAPPPKPLVMGTTMPPTLIRPKVRTHWQPSAKAMFPIEPANDPVQRLVDDDRASMTLLALVLCVTVTVALLGFGLQVLQ